MKHILYEGKLILVEGVEELQKYYPKLDLDKIKSLVALDPTYKGGNEIGIYGKWILGMYYNHIKNESNNQKWDELLQKYPNGINPKTNQPFNKPPELPEVKDEDLYKIPNLLKNYEEHKKELKAITDYNELGTLTQDIMGLQSKKLKADGPAKMNLEVIKAAMVDGFQVIHTGKDWIIGIPATYESSSHFKDCTSWCTAFPRMYDNYKDTYGGEYYILMNRHTGDLYQFHFESNQFMNAADRRIDLQQFFIQHSEVSNFFLKYSLDKGIPPIFTNPLIITNSKIVGNNEAVEKTVQYIVDMFNKHKNFEIRFTKNNKQFWIKVLSTGLETNFNLFNEIIEKYNWTPNFNELSDEDCEKIYSIINKLKGDDKIAFLSLHPKAFFGLNNYTIDDIKSIFKAGYGRTMWGSNDIESALSSRMIKKYGTELQQTIIEELKNLCEIKYPDERALESHYFFTKGIIESFDIDTIVDLIKSINSNIELDKVINENIIKLGANDNNFKLKSARIINSVLDLNLNIWIYDLRDNPEYQTYLLSHLTEKNQSRFIVSILKNKNHLPVNYKIALLGKAPYEVQDMLLKRDMRLMKYVVKPDEKIQKEMIKRDIFNVQYINNLSPKLKKYVLELNPEMKHYIRGN